MKLLLIIILTIIISSKIKAQDVLISEYKTNIDTTIDKYPQFPGGYKMFSSYVKSKFGKALTNNYAEEIVIIGITIDKNGKVRNPKVVRNIGPVLNFTLDSTIMSVLKKSPLSKPGEKKGQTIPSDLQLMVNILPNVKGDPIWTNKPIKIDPNKIYISVQQPPEFPGGQEKLDQFIKEHQLLERNSALDSDKVVISCIVEKNGRLSNIEVVRGVSNIHDGEALVLVKQLPKWHPGIQDGKSVRVRVSIPVLIKK